MVIICWNRRVTSRSQACLTFSLFMERRWVKIKMRKRKLISSPGRHWEILQDSGWINHDVCEPFLKRSQWWDSDHRLENQRRRRRRRRGHFFSKWSYDFYETRYSVIIGLKHNSEQHLGYKFWRNSLTFWAMLHCFLAEWYMKRLIPLTRLYARYEATSIKQLLSAHHVFHDSWALEALVGG